jgi:predicted transposase/invertase (TIGR01784 family)
MEDDNDELVPYRHDSYFKMAFSDPGRAAPFFQEHLPEALVPHIDWPSLALIPGSFVKQSLKQSHCDLLFSVQIGVRSIRLYLLFEHQTTVDEKMPLRMDGYVHEILRQHAETHGLPLPPVLPLLLHQGPDRWTVSTCFEDLFDLPEELRELLLPYVPKFRHLLLDLSQYNPADTEKDAVNRVVLELMRQLRQKHLVEFFVWLDKQELPPLDLLTASLLYAWYSDSNLDLERIADILGDESQLKEVTVSIAATLIAQGEAKGRAQGKAEGKAEGEARGKLKCLQGIMHLPVSDDQELAGLEIAELECRYLDLQRQYEEKFKNR